jgi:hypothetical protein
MLWFEEFHAMLERIGFEAEPFGGTTVVLRTVPAVLAEYPYVEIYRDTFAALAATGRASPYDEIVESMLATLACHDAIKINRPLDLSEMRRLLDDFVHVGAPATCPHDSRQRTPAAFPPILMCRRYEPLGVPSRTVREELGQQPPVHQFHTSNAFSGTGPSVEGDRSGYDVRKV